MLQCLAEVLHVIKKQAISPLTSEGTGLNGSPLQSTDPIQELFVRTLTLSLYWTFFSCHISKLKSYNVPQFFLYLNENKLHFERLADSRNELYSTMLPALLHISKYMSLMFYIFCKKIILFILQFILLKLPIIKQWLVF